MKNETTKESDRFPVFTDHFQFVFSAFVFFFLFEATDYPPGGSPGADHVLVRYRQQVPLLHRQLHVHAGHLLHRLHHFWETRGEKTKTWGVSKLQMVRRSSRRRPWLLLKCLHFLKHVITSSAGLSWLNNQWFSVMKKSTSFSHWNHLKHFAEPLSANILLSKIQSDLSVQDSSSIGFNIFWFETRRFRAEN